MAVAAMAATDVEWKLLSWGDMSLAKYAVAWNRLGRLGPLTLSAHFPLADHVITVYRVLRLDRPSVIDAASAVRAPETLNECHAMACLAQSLGFALSETEQVQPPRWLIAAAEGLFHIHITPIFAGATLVARTARALDYLRQCTRLINDAKSNVGSDGGGAQFPPSVSGASWVEPTSPDQATLQSLCEDVRAILGSSEPSPATRDLFLLEATSKRLSALLRDLCTVTARTTQAYWEGEFPLSLAVLFNTLLALEPLVDALSSDVWLLHVLRAVVLVQSLFLRARSVMRSPDATGIAVAELQVVAEACQRAAPLVTSIPEGMLSHENVRRALAAAVSAHAWQAGVPRVGALNGRLAVADLRLVHFWVAPPAIGARPPVLPDDVQLSPPRWASLL